MEKKQGMQIPLFKIYWDKNDVNAVSSVIKSGRNWATGDFVSLLEKETATYVGSKYCLSFNSGTSALHSLMIAYGIGPGDEVIVPSFTFISSANAPLFVGAKPVFAEIEPASYGLDPKDVEKKITKRTKVIMPTHFGGGACDILALKKIAKKHNLLLLEDAAETLGTTVGKKYTGTFGEAGMYSLCGPKVITTGEGGLVVTNSRDIYERLKLIRSHGRLDTANYFATTKYLDYIQLGYGFRLSNILAALGVSQLRKISSIISLRIKRAAYLTKLLKGVAGVEVPRALAGARHIYQMYTVFVPGGKKTRDALQAYLNSKGIMAKVYFPCVHLTGFYKRQFGYKEGDLPVTEGISDSVLTLPMYPAITDKEVAYIAESIRDFFHDRPH